MFTLRNWATPITIGSFLISALSGILIFFHLNIGLVRPAHEWLSWFMILGVGMHLLLNWRAFTNYFKKPIPLALIGLFTVLTIASLLPLGSSNEGGSNPRVAMMKTMHLLEAAPVSVLADMQQMTPEALLEKMKEQGIQVDNAQQTLEAVATANGQEAAELLGKVLK